MSGAHMTFYFTSNSNSNRSTGPLVIGRSGNLIKEYHSVRLLYSTSVAFTVWPTTTDLSMTTGTLLQMEGPGQAHHSRLKPSLAETSNRDGLVSAGGAHRWNDGRPGLSSPLLRETLYVAARGLAWALPRSLVAQFGDGPHPQRWATSDDSNGR